MNTFTIPIELCDLNTYIDAERANWRIAASIKKKNTESVMLFCAQLDLDPTKQYDVIADWFTKNKKKDSDNVNFAIKFILDGVVKSGKLPGDGYRYIRNIHNNRHIGESKVIITFIEVV